MLRLALPGCLSLVLAAVAAAQAPLPLQREVPPRYAGVYRMSTGELLPPGSRAAHSPGPVVLFNNMVATNYFATPGPGQEWVDEGGLLDRNVCDLDQINGFNFAYCSAHPDPTGSSGTITIRFYDDNPLCQEPPGWPASNCAYELAGLPLGSATGDTQCWLLTVDLSDGSECPATLAGSFRTEGASPSQRFGWSIMAHQPITGPSCRTGGYKISDNFTYFDRLAGRFRGCFSFGGQPYSSFGMKMFGPLPNGIRYGSQNAAWPRPFDTLRLTTLTTVAQGQTAVWQVEAPAAGHNYWLLASVTPQDRGALSGNATLLVTLADLVPSGPIAMPGGTASATIPPNPPHNVYMQAVETIGPLAASNVTALSNGLVHCF